MESGAGVERCHPREGKAGMICRGASGAALAAAILFGAAGAGAEEAPAISPGAVLSLIEGNWSGAPLERAVLVAGETDASLYIYVSEGGPREMRLAAAAPDIAWYGALFGTVPELALNAAGSLQVISRNESIGRHRWREVLTVAHRTGRFVVAGYTYEGYDTLDPAAGGSCDVNLLTGRGLRDGEPFETEARAVSLEAWTAADAPEACFD